MIEGNNEEVKSKKEEGAKKEAGAKKLDPVMLVCLIIGVALIIFAIVKLIMIGLEYQVSENEYKDIANTYVEVKKDVNISDVNDTEEDTIEWYELATVDVKGLQEKNPDVCGYIMFENEDISYPVLHASDNDYYLHRTIEKTEAKAGSIFVDCGNTSDFEDAHTIIYGHNMKNLSMFGRLRYYRTDKDYYDDHQYFQLFVDGAVYRYQIYAYKVVEDGAYIYQLYYDGGEDFAEFANKIGSQSSRNTGIEIGPDDKVITMSTCTGNDEERFVVSAVRVDQHYFDVDEDETETETEAEGE